MCSSWGPSKYLLGRNQVYYKQVCNIINRFIILYASIGSLHAATISPKPSKVNCYERGISELKFIYSQTKHTLGANSLMCDLQEGMSLDSIIEDYNVSNRNSHSMMMPRVRTSCNVYYLDMW